MLGEEQGRSLKHARGRSCLPGRHFTGFWQLVRLPSQRDRSWDNDGSVVGESVGPHVAGTIELCIPLALYLTQCWCPRGELRGDRTSLFVLLPGVASIVSSFCFSPELTSWCFEDGWLILACWGYQGAPSLVTVWHCNPGLGSNSLLNPGWIWICGNRYPHSPEPWAYSHEPVYQTKSGFLE